MLGAVALQGGHTLWIVVGFLAMGMFDLRAADVMLMGALVAWLAVRPGTVPVVVLTLLQAFGFVVNLVAFSGAPVGSLEHKSLLVHILLRGAGVLLMWKALPTVRDLWDKQDRETVPPAQTPEFPGTWKNTPAASPQNQDHRKVA